MDDLISRQAAIDKFEPWLKVRGYSEGELNMLKAVLYELRFLPSVQPEILACGEGELNVPDTNVGDTISRRAAIDALGEKPLGDTDWDLGCRNQWEWDTEILKTLPSAQPEIIRCNSCKHWTQSTGKMKGYGLGRCDFHDVYLVTCNGFCYWAERRTDG